MSPKTGGFPVKNTTSLAGCPGVRQGSCYPPAHSCWRCCLSVLHHCLHPPPHLHLFPSLPWSSLPPTEMGPRGWKKNSAKSTRPQTREEKELTSSFDFSDLLLSPRATSTDLFLRQEASSLHATTQGSPGLTEAHRVRHGRQVWVTCSSLPPQLADALLTLGIDFPSKRNQKEGHEFQVSHSQNAFLKGPLG